MVVNHFNTFPYGGAAIAAKRLHRQLNAVGVESRFLYHINDRDGDVGDLEESSGYLRSSSPLRNAIGRFFEKRRVKKIRADFDRYLSDRNSDLELFSMAELVEKSELNPRQFENQIVHLHWLAFAVDYPSFFSSIADSTPVVWSLHDMAPMTGGCHYSNGCEKFKTSCGQCPQLNSDLRNDLSRKGFRIKKRSLAPTNLTVVTPSRWMLELAMQSPVFPISTRFEHIQLGFDLSAYRPINKRQAREALSASRDRTVIGFGAESIANHRKGFDLLLDALARLDCKDQVECFVFGSGELGADANDLPPIRNFGVIVDEDQMANFYSSCDVVIVPSREDNQPQVGLEAMACGTPVVGFDVGGIGEYVRPGKTGLLADAENAADMSRQIGTLVGDADLRKAMSVRCREMMESEFDIVKQAEKYAQLYRELLAAKISRAA